MHKPVDNNTEDDFCYQTIKLTILCTFRSLPPKEHLLKNLSIFLQCLGHYFLKTKEQNLTHFQDQNENSLPVG